MRSIDTALKQTVTIEEILLAVKEQCMKTPGLIRTMSVFSVSERTTLKEELLEMTRCIFQLCLSFL